MLPDRDAASLQDIATACRRIGEFIRGMDEDSFLADARTQSAVMHQLLVIGEAVKRLSVECRGRHPDIPWARIARTRDMLIHHYEAVDAAEVWRIAQLNIPELRAAVDPLLPPPESEV